MYEGKNRQIRRMLRTVGAKVKDLNRIRFGSVKLGNLKVGNFRHLEKKEVLSLQKNG